MSKRLIQALVVVVMCVGLVLGSVAAVQACHLCWTERTIDIDVRDAMGVTPEKNIQVEVYRGCCTSATYTVTNLADEAISVCIEQVGDLPDGINAWIEGGTPVTLAIGETKDVTVNICASCDAVDGSVTYRFASNICADCPDQFQPCPDCPE